MDVRSTLLNLIPCWMAGCRWASLSHGSEKRGVSSASGHERRPPLKASQSRRHRPQPPSRPASRPLARSPQARLELGEAQALGAAAMEIKMRREPAHRRGCDQGIDQKIGRREVEAGAQRALEPEARQLARERGRGRWAEVEEMVGD